MAMTLAEHTVPEAGAAPAPRREPLLQVDDITVRFGAVLDNIRPGRLLKMRGHFLLDAIYWGPAKRQELEHRAAVERVIDFLEIQAIRKTPAGRLPYGLQKRVELARALAAEPKLLLLDEPMAGLNREGKKDMCPGILDGNPQVGTTHALIQHDKGVGMDISDRVMVLDYGCKIADGL